MHPLDLVLCLQLLCVGLLTSSTVSSGTYRVIARDRALIRARVGRDIAVRLLAAHDLPRASGNVGPDIKVVSDPA